MADLTTASGPSPVRRVLPVLGLVALAAIVVLAVRVLLLLFAGVLLAIVLRAAATFASKRLGLRYGIALAAIVIATVASTVVGSIALAPRIGDQLTELSNQLPRAADTVRERLHRVPIVRQSTSPDARELKPEARSILAVVAGAVGTSFELAGGLVMVVFVGIYGAAQPDQYRRAVLGLVPRAHMSRAERAWGDVSTNLSRWLLGRLVAMLFVFVTCAIAFAVMGVPLAITLAFLAGLLTFVEYVGAVVSAIPPALLAFTKSPALAVAVLVLFTVIHVVEGYVLTPLLARRSVHIPPAFTIAAQVVLAALVGPLGLTFATPLFVVVASSVRAWRDEPSPSSASRARQA